MLVGEVDESLEAIQVVEDKLVSNATVIEGQLWVLFNVDSDPLHVALGPCTIGNLLVEEGLGALHQSVDLLRVLVRVEVGNDGVVVTLEEIVQLIALRSQFKDCSRGKRGQVGYSCDLRKFVEELHALESC